MFGYYAFEELDPIKTEKDEEICDIQQQDDQPIPVDTKVDWGLSAKDKLERLNQLMNFVLIC